MTLPDPTLLCREAEEWAARLRDEAHWGRVDGANVLLNCTDARSLASLLSQLATLARAQAHRT